jgi:hypothetical protein
MRFNNTRRKIKTKDKRLSLRKPICDVKKRYRICLADKIRHKQLTILYDKLIDLMNDS